MVKQVIEIGTAPAGQDGDTNREASIKINSNFTELYVAIGNVVRGPSMAIGGEVALFSGTTGKDIVGGGVLGSAAFRAAGSANGVATLDASTKVPLAQLPTGASGLATLGPDGKLPTAQLPPLAVNEVFTVASQAAMLALTAERGDVAVRSDQSGKTYILSQDDPTSLANWVPLQQALSAALAALNALTPAADRIPFFTGASTADLLPVTSIGKVLIAIADAAAGRAAISAAKSGANSDITSLSALSTPLSLNQGGTGKTSMGAASVGTTSQSAGVPTGAIIEKGSNAQGSYVRYADGTQICWREVGTGSAMNNAVGSVYNSGAVYPGSYPAPFIALPVVTGSAGYFGTGIGICWAASYEPVLVNGWGGWVAVSPVATGAFGTIRLMAIGRWY